MLTESPTADTQTTLARQDVGLSSKINLSLRRIGWIALVKQFLQVRVGLRNSLAGGARCNTVLGARCKGASQAAGGPGATPESAPEIPTMEAMAMTSLTPKSAA